jgi:hypothetical protein
VERDASQQQQQRLLTALAVVTASVGLALRLWILASPAGRVDSDEAVVGLMGQWIADGHRPPWFFWGQHYGGTIEPILVGFALKVHHGRLVLKAVPLALSAVSAFILARAARRLMPRANARLAGALLFAWPGTTWLATKERGFYWAGMVLVCAALWIAAELVATTATDRNRWRLWAVYGGVVGFAWYTTPQSMFVLLGLTGWLLLNRCTRRDAAIGFAGFVIGSSPWLWGWAHDGAKVFEQPAPSAPYLERLSKVTFTLIPRALGLRTVFIDGWTLGPFGVAMWIALLTLVAGSTVYALRFRDRVPPFVQILLILAISFPLLAAIPALSIFVSEPRYGLYVIPVVVLLAAPLLRYRATTYAIVAVVLLLALAGTNTVVSTSQQSRQPLLDLAPTDLAPVKQALIEREITHVYADYWLANPLTFRNSPTIVATPLESARVEWSRVEVDASGTNVWIVYRGSVRDRALPQELATRGVSVTREPVGEIAIYHLSRYLNPNDLGAFWSRYPAGSQSQR